MTMPWTRPNRWIFSLLLLSVFALGVAATIVLQRARVGGDLSPTEERIVGGCLTITLIAGGFARLEYVTRKKAHDLAGGQNVIGLAAEAAARKADDAAAEAKKANDTLPERVVQELNGGLDKAVQRKLDESPFPTTPEQLRKFIADSRSELCGDLARTAAKEAVQEMQRKGWQPPPPGGALT